MNSGRKIVVRKNVSYQDAIEHCYDPETLSVTCKSPEGRRRTERSGPWFDTFRSQDNED